MDEETLDTVAKVYELVVEAGYTVQNPFRSQRLQR